MSESSIKTALLELSHALGEESRQFALLGEGNTSALASDGSFWVKASGSSLATLREEDLSEVDLEGVLSLIEQPLTETEIEAALRAVRLNEQHKKPSVETFMHALCLSIGDATWVGHTHTVSVNQLLCSKHGASIFKRHVLPDAIVVCGRHVASVPYTNPGLDLARAVKQALLGFKAQHGYAPRVLLLENHGPVALGQSAKDVLNIMLMLDKWAKILLGALAAGEPAFLSDEDADVIHARLDEAYRRAAIREERA